MNKKDINKDADKCEPKCNKCKKDSPEKKVKNKMTNKDINYKEKYLITLAEMENLRKRLDQDKADFIKYKASSFIYDVLPTIDIFEQALEQKNVSKEIKSWLSGFEMVLRSLKEALKNEGVKEIIVKKGDEFNGELHHSFETVKTKDVKPGQIYKVNQKGYTIHERLLRPAIVQVAEEGE